MLSKLLDRFAKEKQVITGGCDNADPHAPVYLRRWVLFGALWSPPEPRWWMPKWVGRILVHHFVRSDADRELHDHPWPFFSLILRHGYIEETEAGLTYIRPWRIIYRPANWRHRVHVQPGKTPWTIIFTGHKERTWFFWRDGVAIPWREFLAAKCAGQQSQVQKKEVA